MAVIYRGRRLPAGVWEFCEFLESGENCSSKMWPRHILTLLAFGAVSLRLLDLGVPEGSLVHTDAEVPCGSVYSTDNSVLRRAG